ncbi:hypothetical protein TIFTF001_039706 [Ficus carica]|uniref:Retrotransposon gag domain-containing protein n=1 Tax=Ficus carica TaxID=3494 RepID=A0AA88E9M5_FICCA|nr:hypothetical protein TIFTF001_039706 [Ficus carica]
MLDDMMCKLFAQSLKGAALRWFYNLPPESIDSFHEHSLEFMRNFSVHIQLGKTTKDLWGVEALKKGLRHRSLLRNEICARYPPTIQDALHRAKGFIELEEENERVERDWARTREAVAKVRNEREKTFRHERTHPAQRTEHREGRTTRRDHKRPLSPPKYALGISSSEQIAHLKRQDFVTALRAEVAKQLNRVTFRNSSPRKVEIRMDLATSPKNKELCSRLKIRLHLCPFER